MLGHSTLPHHATIANPLDPSEPFVIEATTAEKLLKTARSHARELARVDRLEEAIAIAAWYTDQTDTDIMNELIEINLNPSANGVIMGVK